jgi:hypothetical protein
LYPVDNKQLLTSPPSLWKAPVENPDRPEIHRNSDHFTKIPWRIVGAFPQPDRRVIRVANCPAEHAADPAVQ